MKTVLERFENKFVPEPNSGCWLWTAFTTPKGYGQFWDGICIWRAHRFSYKLYKGPIPKGLFVLHKCDVPECVNPDHLFTGTNAENVADMVSKGRQQKGPSHWKAKLHRDMPQT